MSEFKIWKNEHLPPSTMVVSPDIYDLLTKTSEERVKDLEKTVADLNSWMNILKPRGGNNVG